MRLAMGMSSRVLAPNEVAPLRHMYVVSRGLVLFGGRVLSQGMACKLHPTIPIERQTCSLCICDLMLIDIDQSFALAIRLLQGATTSS